MLKSPMAQQEHQRDSDDDSDCDDIESCQANSHATSEKSSTDDETAPNSPEGSQKSTTSSSSTDSNESTTNPLVQQLFQKNKPIINIPALPIIGVANRLRKGFELRLTKTIKIVLNDQNRWFSYITPVGLFQYNSEWKEFKCQLEPMLLEQIGLGDYMNQAALLDITTEVNINDQLCIKQWQMLEKYLQEHQGHTVLGYSINEEVFLWFWGHVLQLGYKTLRILGGEAHEYEYPPRVDDFEKQLLDKVQLPIVRDITTSIRTAGQALLLLNCLVSMSLSYTTNQQTYTDYYNFSIKNAVWYVVGTAGIAVLSFISLKSPCLNKEKVSAILNRLRLIMESVVGTSQNWISYAPLILPPPAVAYGILPAILYGVRKGRHDDNALYSFNSINVANSTLRKTVLIGLSYASTNGSFFYLGSLFIINSSLFYYKDLGNPRVHAELNLILTSIQYSIVVLSFFAHLMRYPYANTSTKIAGRYATNIIQALSNAFLDNFTTFEIISGALGTGFNIPIATPQDVAFNSCYFSLQAMAFLGALLITPPNTPDIPELSIEPIPVKESLTTKIYKYSKGLFFPDKEIHGQKKHTNSIELTM